MAFLLQYNDLFGGEHEQAYAKIIMEKYNHHSKYAQIHVGIYRTTEDRLNYKEPLILKKHSYRGEEYTRLFSEITSESTKGRIYKELKEKEDIYSESSDLIDMVGGIEVGIMGADYLIVGDDGAFTIDGSKFSAAHDLDVLVPDPDA